MASFYARVIGGSSVPQAYNRCLPQGVEVMTVISRIACVLALLPATIAAQDHQHPNGERLGTVHFETTCADSVRGTFDHAMALLHSFEFGPAIQGFEETLKIDPRCAMAYWGIAVARWTNPFAAAIRTPQQVQAGLEAVTRAKAAGARSERERAYINAVAMLYTDAATIDQRTRVVAYEKAMGALAASYPDDAEASIFWALSLTASAPAADKTYANQLKAAPILEQLLPKYPDHPGITHYIIHTYDVPALANRAIAAAHRYAEIAPAAPHALHMPSHTFTRVGAWQESIDANRASAAAALRANARGEQLHALDYLAYAYLQTGQDAAAQALVGELPEIARAFDSSAVSGAAGGLGGVFALAAIPARWVLERRDWPAATRLASPASPSAFAYTDAMTHFARALGASHTAALPVARQAIEALADIQARLSRANESYWAEQVAIQHDTAVAFLALAEGRTQDAVAQMRAAATREDATEKNAVTPGPLAPARELLGEMLMELKRPAEALVEFEATIKKEPNRFRGLYGAAKAASLAGDRTKAQLYFGQLLEISKPADAPGRPELAEARSFVAR
jgi:hypothetical protein